MPNWVTNTVTFKGNVEQLKKELLDENGNFSFNNIIPMPDDLSIESGSGSWNMDKFGFMREDETLLQDTIKPFFENAYNDEISQADYVVKVLATMPPIVAQAFQTYYKERECSEERQREFTELRIKGFFNLQRYGEVDWYEWSYKNWGTKWDINSEETEIVEREDGLQIRFDTAWSTPFGIWENLMNKGLNFTVAYADEDLGSNFGVLIFQDKTSNELAIDEYIDQADFEECLCMASTIKYGVDDDYTEWYDEHHLTDERMSEISEVVAEFLM